MKIVGGIGKAIAWIVKIFAMIFIVLMSFILLVNTCAVGKYGYQFLTGRLVAADAEIISIESEISTSENPRKYAELYSYNIKYLFNGEEVTTDEPILATRIAEVGDTIKFELNTETGVIKGFRFVGLDDSFNTIYWAITYILLASLLIKSINIVLKEGKGSFLYGVKRCVLGAISIFLIQTAIELFLGIAFIVPNYFNGNYMWVPSTVSNIVEDSILEDGVSGGKWYEMWEYKGQYFESYNYFYLEDHVQKIGDEQKTMIDIRTGEMAPEQGFEYVLFGDNYHNGIICMILGVVLNVLSKIRRKKKIKDSVSVIDSTVNYYKNCDNINNDENAEETNNFEEK